MTLIANREALPRALWNADREAHPHTPGFGETWETEPCQDSYKRIVDALLASGAVVDAATLAHERCSEVELWIDRLSHVDGAEHVRDLLRKRRDELAAAPAERGEQP